VAPLQVLDEIAEGRRLGFLSELGWELVAAIDLTEDELARAEQLERRLGPGEAACLAVAEARGYPVLTDDRAARRTAKELGLQLSGTLGVLVRLVDSHVLTVTQADALLGPMLAAGYRCPIESLDEIR
jgi:predicted nucleic acid-binding protein